MTDISDEDPRWMEWREWPRDQILPKRLMEISIASSNYYDNPDAIIKVVASHLLLIDALIEIDDLLCEIITGNQGSFVPHHGTASMARLALDRLRIALPLKERL